MSNASNPIVDHEVSLPVVDPEVSLKATYKRKLLKKTAITLAVITVVAGIFAGIYGLIGQEKSLSALHAVSDLFEKVASSPGIFVVGALIFGALYVAVRVCRLSTPKPKQKFKNLIDDPVIPKRASSDERFLKKLVVGFIALVVIGGIAMGCSHSAKEATKDFFSKWDQPEVLLPGFIAGAAIVGLITWMLWMVKKEKVEDPFKIKVGSEPDPVIQQPAPGPTSRPKVSRKREERGIADHGRPLPLVPDQDKSQPQRKNNSHKPLSANPLPHTRPSQDGGKK